MDRELRRNNFFLKTVYGKYVTASILSMLAASMSGMIDTVIVGRFLGETGLAAMSLVGPVYLFYYTIGAVIGMGGSIAANLYVGKNDYDSYRQVFTLSFWMTTAVCVLTTALALLAMEPLLSLLGGEGLVREYAADYLFWYVIGGSGTLFIYLPLNFLKSEGKPQASSLLFLLSGGLNVLLTWLFLSPVCGMGMKGASIATGLSMSLTAGIGLFLLFRKTMNTRLVKMRPAARLMGEILVCGSPNGCNNLLNALKVLLINGMLLGIGAASYLPVFSLVKSVSDLVTGIMTGVASALMPIVGVFLGEKDWGSIRRICQRAMKVGGILTVASSALATLFPGLFCFIFNITEPSARQGSRQAMICLAVSFLFAFPNLMMSGYFNTIQRSMLSNLVLSLRLFFYLAPAVLLLGSFAGVEGIWMALAAADILTLGTILLVVKGIRRRSPCLDRYLLDTSREGEGEISFSVRNTMEDVMFASNKITEFCESSGITAKKTMQVSLAIEEMLTVIVTYCIPKEHLEMSASSRQTEQFIDIRIMRTGEDVLLCIRNSGKIFDPVRFYEENRENEEMEDEVLGIKMIVGTAKDIQFRETFGMNHLVILF